jgi:hypothetical protein
MGGKTLSDAQFFAVLNADVVEMPLSDGTMRSRYYRQRENDTSILFLNANPTGLNYISVDKNTKMVTFNSTNLLTGSAGSITTKMLADGAVTSSKLAPGLDVSGLFFILPAGTKFPYTLTEEDKTKLVNARFLVCVGRDGCVSVALHPVVKSYVGPWFSIYSTSRFAFIGVTESVISEPSSIPLYDLNSVRFSSAQTLTAAQKLQARTNIESADAGLFFILPAGTKFPYTLTEEDKTKLSAATILILPTVRGATPFQRSSNEGIWCSLRYTNTFWTAAVSESSISAPVALKIIDDTAVKFTAQTLTAGQKLQARTNIGAAEDPDTSGDSQATLEEPPVADEETIP